MKKIICLLLTGSFIVSGLWSCTGDPAQTGDLIPESVELRGDPMTFFNLFENLASNYEQVFVPVDAKEEMIFKTVFSAATGRYLVPEKFESLDIYAGVYQGWYAATLSQVSGRSHVEEYSDAPTVGLRAGSYPSLSYWDEGLLYQKMMESIYLNVGESILSSIESEILAEVIRYLLEIEDVDLDRAAQRSLRDDMEDISDILEMALAYRDPANDNIDGKSRINGYFMSRDGVNYLSTLYGEQQNILTVLGRMLEVALSEIPLTSEDNPTLTKKDFIDKLETLCNKQENQWIYNEGYITRAQADKMIRTVSTAVFANEFWRYYDQEEPVVIPSLKVSKNIFFVGNGGPEYFNVTSNTDWRITTTSSKIDFTAISGSGNQRVGVAANTFSLSGSLATFAVNYNDENGNPVDTHMTVYIPSNSNNPYLRFENEELLVDVCGGVYLSEVTSNTVWTTYIKDVFPDSPIPFSPWYEVPICRGFTRGTRYISTNIGYNNTGSERIGSINVWYYDVQGNAHKVSQPIRQVADWIISISPEVYYIGRNGGEIPVSVNCSHKLTWEARNAYTQVIASGSGNGTFNVTIPAMSGGFEERFYTPAQIYFYYNGTEVAYRQMIVHQSY